VSVSVLSLTSDPAYLQTVRRVHVGCGPHAQLEGWCNSDVRPFKGVDHVMDATEPWPFSGLTHVFGEHFLEHLDIDKAIDFLVHAGTSLAPGGRIRLSTPNLAWVMAAHLTHGEAADVDERIENTLAVNRGFYGWGHRFLWTAEMLTGVMASLGYEQVELYDYGHSRDPQLTGLERHGNHSVRDGLPSVIIAEGVRGATPIAHNPSIQAWIDHEFLRHVRSGH
jgi:predicted SAM-dependent methyltransferase